MRGVVVQAACCPKIRRPFYVETRWEDELELRRKHAGNVGAVNCLAAEDGVIGPMAERIAVVRPRP